MKPAPQQTESKAFDRHAHAVHMARRRWGAPRKVTTDGLAPDQIEALIAIAGAFRASNARAEANRG